MKKRKTTFPVHCASLIVLLLLKTPVHAGEKDFHGESSPQKSSKIIYSEEAENLFDQGVILYRNGEYEQARLKFLQLVTMSPHQRITVSLLMQAKSLGKLGKYRESNRTAAELLGKYPASSYTDDAHLLMAANYYYLNNYYDSAREFIWVIDNSPSDKLWKDGARLLESLADAELSTTELKILDADFAGARSKVLLTVKLAERELQEGRKSDALTRLEKFIEQYPASRTLPRISSLLEWARSDRLGSIKVGVILPLTGYFSEEGKAVLRGIQYGLKVLDDNVARSVELVVRDSESEIVRAVELAQQLSRDRSLLCIIGELDNITTVAIGAALSETNIPLLIPVSSDNGLTRIGDRIFQLSADLDRQGSECARYAIEQLGYTSFITFAPQDHYGRMITDSFVETVDALGGVIVAQKWYYEGTADVGRQMKSLREIGLKRDILQKLSEEMTHVSSAQLEAVWRKENEKFKEESDEKEDLVESKVVPVTSIDAAFFPIYNEDISIIAPQFKLENIHAQILGGSYWRDLEQLRLNRNYVDEVIFVTDHFVDELSKDYILFVDDFRLKMGTTPGEYEYYGYDTIHYALKAMREGGTSRDGFARNLLSVSRFEGVKGDISLDPSHRVNRAVTFVQYREGTLNEIK